MHQIKDNTKDTVDKQDFERLLAWYRQSADELERHRLSLLRQRMHDNHLIDKLDNQHILQSLIGLNKVEVVIQTTQMAIQQEK